MRTVTNMYIANLAFADVTIALFAIAFQFETILRLIWEQFSHQFGDTLNLTYLLKIPYVYRISLNKVRGH